MYLLASQPARNVALKINMTVVEKIYLGVERVWKSYLGSH